MERNRWDKKRGKLFGGFSFFLLLLSVFVFSGISEAAVTLSPRYNGTNIDAAREQYVYLGKYEHRLGMHNGISEDIATPILWRVMELKDHGAGKKGAILLSHYLLESMAYQGTTTGNPDYYRPGTSIPAHTWDASEVQSWLNSSDVSVSVKLGKTDTYQNIKGFLHPSYFSSVEQGVMLDYPYDRYSEGESVPATGTKIVLPSGKYEGSGPFYDKYEMGTWFESQETNANNNTRKAYFKDGSSSWYYWTRSPSASDSIIAYNVHLDGKVILDNVYYAASAVRPALFLNLESIIFKSASNDFAPGSPAQPPTGGQILNPYVLVLPNAVPTSVSGWATTFISADKAPSGAVINGKNMIVSWNADISPAVKRWPAPGDFKLSTGESPTSVTGDDTNPKLLKLTFATGVTAGATVTLSYNLNTDAISHDLSGTPSVEVVNSFTNIAVTNNTPSSGGVTPSVTPTQVRFDGASPADLKFLLSGAALTAANAGNLSIVAETPNGTRTPLGTGDYSRESRNLTILQTFLSKLGDGTHTVYLYNGEKQVGKITLTITGSTGGDTTKDSGSSGCNAGAGSAALLAMGMMLLGLNKTGARKKK